MVFKIFLFCLVLKAVNSQLLIPHEATLDPDGKYVLGWVVNYSSENVIFTATVETKGFIGFGISSSGGMTGADIVIGGVDDGGEKYFEDCHGTGTSRPIPDSQQNWVILSGSENETHTVISFYRQWNTGDSNDLSLTVDPTNWIWSFGETDNVTYHGLNRGAFPVTPLDPDMIQTTPTEGSTTSDGTTTTTTERPNDVITREEILDADGKFVLKSVINYGQENVLFTATVETKGFIGFGLSQDGNLDGADIVIGGIGDDNVTYFKDYHGVGELEPVEDSSQNWFLISALEDDTHTILQFYRKWDTEDIEDLPLNNDPAFWIWSYGDTDNIDFIGTSNRGEFQTIPIPDIPDTTTTTTTTTVETTTTTTNAETTSTTEKPNVVITREEILDADGKFVLKSVINYGQENVLFTATVETKGFIGFGLSQDGNLDGADIVIGGIGDDNVTYFKDYHGVGELEPVEDSSQVEWVFISALENTTHTILQFYRFWDTGDSEDLPLTNESAFWVWSYGDTDQVDFIGTVNRGVFPTIPIPDLPDVTNNPDSTTTATTSEDPVTTTSVDPATSTLDPVTTTSLDPVTTTTLDPITTTLDPIPTTTLDPDTTTTLDPVTTTSLDPITTTLDPAPTTTLDPVTTTTFDPITTTTVDPITTTTSDPITTSLDPITTTTVDPITTTSVTTLDPITTTSVDPISTTRNTTTTTTTTTRRPPSTSTTTLSTTSFPTTSDSTDFSSPSTENPNTGNLQTTGNVIVVIFITIIAKLAL